MRGARRLVARVNDARDTGGNQDERAAGHDADDESLEALARRRREKHVPGRSAVLLLVPFGVAHGEVEAHGGDRRLRSERLARGAGQGEALGAEDLEYVGCLKLLRRFGGDDWLADRCVHGGRPFLWER